MRKEKKELKEVRKIKKLKTKEVYEVSKDCKLAWESLRPESCPPEKKKELCQQIFDQMKPFLKKVGSHYN